MTERTLSDQARAVGSAVATGAAVVGVVVATALDDDVAIGEAVVGTVILLPVFAVAAASIVALMWFVAPGDIRLSRADRVRVNRAVRLGATVDDARLAPSVVRRAERVARRLERGRKNMGYLAQWVFTLPALWAGHRLYDGDLWQAGAAAVLALVLGWQRPHWAAALERQRDRALTAGKAVVTLLPPPA